MLNFWHGPYCFFAHISFKVCDESNERKWMKTSKKRNSIDVNLLMLLITFFEVKNVFLD